MAAERILVSISTNIEPNSLAQVDQLNLKSIEIVFGVQQFSRLLENLFIGLCHEHAIFDRNV